MQASSYKMKVDEKKKFNFVCKEMMKWFITTKLYVKKFQRITFQFFLTYQRFYLKMIEFFTIYNI